MANKVKLYIASTLDGFIARRNESVDWLESLSGKDEDYGYNEFIRNVGAAVMGSRTYAENLKHPERMLSGIPMYVFTKRSLRAPVTEQVEFVSGDLKEGVTRIRRSTPKDVWIMGGGKFASACLAAGVVDEIYHFVAPVLLGQGVSLYRALKKEMGLKLLDSKRYSSGIVLLHYAVSGA